MAPPINIAIDPKLVPAPPHGSTMLSVERSKASFDPVEMKTYLYGETFIKRLEMVLDVIENEPAFDKSSVQYMSRLEKFEHALRKDKRLIQIVKELKWDRDTESMADFLIDEPGPFGLHKQMYITTLAGQGDDEQQAKFLGPAQAYDHIGCYAQTELGHGSNVQGLETTATYIEDSDEFELHSPHLTSSKWWIGGLGRSATHACVMAQLIIKGKSYGPTPFICQIRDLQTQQPLPGRTIGDIGPKFGYNTTDNGFLLFNHVRIPRTNMLMRYSKVKKGGEYVKPPNKALAYGTLTFVRANIVMQSRMVLMRAATIAIRYCSIRRQFIDRDAPKLDTGKPVETAVIDYTMVQYRLLPILAQAFALHFTGKDMFKLYAKSQESVKGGDLTLIADVHASSSGLKSLVTTMAADGIEVCRRACGGHGYSTVSGLSSFYQDYLPNCSWEGDNFILTQQVARYLFKTYRNVVSGEGNESSHNPTLEYLKSFLNNPNQTCNVRHSGDFYDSTIIVRAFGQRAAHLVHEGIKRRDQEKRTWNSLLVEINRISVAHAQYILVRNFANALYDEKSDLKNKIAIKHVLETLFQLFALTTIEKEGAEFLACGYLTPAQYLLVKQRVMELLAEVRPQAVPLVDSFGMPDYILNSALGASDGKVYERLFDQAVREPLNAQTIDVNYRSSVLYRGKPALAKL